MYGAAARFCRRLGHAPFETLIALLAIATAIVSLLQVGGVASNPYDAVLPHWAADTFQAGYLLSGLLLLAGIGGARADIESAGLVVIASAQITRSVVNVALIGPALGAVSLVFTVLVVGACGTRLWQLIRATSRGVPHG